MNYTVTIDGVLHYETECEECEGRGAYEMIIPGTQGYDRYSLPSWEWRKCYECDGTGVTYEEVELDEIN